MNPMVRIALLLAALTGAALISRVAWPPVAANLAAMKSWNRIEGEVRGLNEGAEFEIGQDPDSYRVSAAVEHTWGLSLFKKAPLFVDPSDRMRVKPAGVLQMWLMPAGMFLFVLALLAVAWTAVRIGSGVEMQAAGSGWMVTPSPGPLSGGVIVHSPERQWKIVMCWSLLGVAMAVITMFSSGGNPLSRIWYISLGSAFALGLWGFAWHTKTLEISANDQGVRTTSALGWREVPWALVRGMEDQDLATTYYNGRMRMWELPFPGSTIRVMAFNDERGRALMSFSPELVPKEGLQSLFDLCRARTGAKLEKRQIRMPF